MLVFKDPVPLNITRAEAIRMGREAAARFGYTDPLKIAHMANEMGGRVDPMESRMSGERFDLIVFRDGSFEVNTGMLLTVDRRRLRQMVGLGHAALHINRSDPADLRTVVPVISENEPAALRRCRTEAIGFAAGALLRPDVVFRMSYQDRPDAEILAACGLPSFCSAYLDEVRAELAEDGIDIAGVA